MKILLQEKNKFKELNTFNLKKIGQGCESIVYKYKNNAVKIYKKNCKKEILSYNDVKYMKDINTKRILMPLNIVYKNNLFSLPTFKGYSTTLIKNSKPLSSIIKMDSNYLYKELEKLEIDAKILSNSNVEISDLRNAENFIFNDKLYYVDPGSYYINNILNCSQIYNNNMDELGISLNEILFCLDGNLENIKEELMNIEGIEYSNVNINTTLPLVRKIYENDYYKNYLKSKKRYYLEYLKDILNKYESISNYKLNIFKNYINDPNSDSVYINHIKKIIK